MREEQVSTILSADLVAACCGVGVLMDEYGGKCLGLDHSVTDEVLWHCRSLQISVPLLAHEFTDAREIVQKNDDGVDGIALLDVVDDHDGNVGNGDEGQVRFVVLECDVLSVVVVAEDLYDYYLIKLYITIHGRQE